MGSQWQAGNCIRFQFQLCALLVGEPERRLVERDRGFELDASAATVPPAKVLELAFGGGELLGCPGALPLELLLLPGKEPRGRVAVPCRMVERERRRRSECDTRTAA